MLKYEDIVAKVFSVTDTTWAWMSLHFAMHIWATKSNKPERSETGQRLRTSYWEKRKQRHNWTTSRCITATGQMEINKSALDEESLQVHLKFKSKNMNWSNFHSTWGGITGSPYNMDALGWDGAAYGCSFCQSYVGTVSLYNLCSHEHKIPLNNRKYVQHTPVGCLLSR